MKMAKSHEQCCMGEGVGWMVVSEFIECFKTFCPQETSLALLFVVPFSVSVGKLHTGVEE